jgi:crossover junction endodeoxyribonuclease RuvC
MNYLGIDPGLDGAAAIIMDKAIVFLDTPTLEVTGGKKTKRHYDLPAICTWVSGLNTNLTAALEDVHAMPKQGVVSSFSFGQGLGIWKGIIAAFGIPLTMVRPERWKKEMLGGRGQGKDAGRLRALELFPKAELQLKKHHGRADALLLAEWLRRQDCRG